MVGVSWVSSGIEALDRVIQGLRLGDNVVWQVDDLDDYAHYARLFAARAVDEGAPCVYVRFAPHAPILEGGPGVEIVRVDPGKGFDAFSKEIHEVVEKAGRKVRHVFDNLSALALEWATDEQIANFFQFACPYLYELDTVAYFGLIRRRHDAKAIARIRDTTQVLFDLFRVGENRYIHPLKASGRYGPSMFVPHLIDGERLVPVFQSGAAAAILASARPRPLGTQASSIAPWDTVYQRLLERRNEGISEDDPEIVPLKQEFARMLLGNQSRINELADRYLTLEDLFRIRERMIGSGRIGGKATGMILARRILHASSKVFDYGTILEDHDSFYIGSDVFYSFLVNNGLFRLRWQLSKEGEISREAFEEVERRFLEGEFAPEIVEQFRNMLDYYGQAPIIVRSSSLLEDGFGNAFAGKYRSEFCANQGSPNERLEEFMRTVKLVYASTLNPDALSYRRKRNLIDKDEQMAILVQRVSGSTYKHYFFPSIAGVAHSRNLFVWTDRIDEKQGLVRMVFGLGTRAVNRVGGDYPRMFAVSHPALRPDFGRQVLKYSQRRVDLIDLAQNRFATEPASELLSGRDYPQLSYFASVWRDDQLTDAWTPWATGDGDPMVLTFNNLIERTDFVAMIRDILATLEKAYGHPVDIEFTASVDGEGKVRINLVQCRPLFMPGSGAVARRGGRIPKGRVLFRSSGAIRGGSVSKIRYILYVDPAAYQRAPVAVKRSLPQVIGRINRLAHMAGERLMMIGPGRWGSSSIDLGIGVGYAQINHAQVLVEMAREAAGMAPDFSYGTHFFQDLVEDEIFYLAVNPDDPASEFNETFFSNAPNALHDALHAEVPTNDAGSSSTDAGEYSALVRLIDVPAAAGVHAAVIADPEARSGVCFLEDGASPEE